MTAEFVYRIIVAACSVHLLWTGLAVERWTIRPRTWLLARWPNDQAKFGLQDRAWPRRYTRVEQWELSPNLLTAPVNLPRFSWVNDRWQRTDQGVAPVDHEGPFPSPAVVQDMNRNAWYGLLVNNQYMSGWVRHTDHGLLLMGESEKFPKLHMVRDDTGWVVPEGHGRWFTSLLMCHKCFGWWASVAATILILNVPFSVVRYGTVTVIAIAARIVNRYS